MEWQLRANSWQIHHRHHQSCTCTRQCKEWGRLSICLSDGILLLANNHSLILCYRHNIGLVPYELLLIQGSLPDQHSDLGGLALQHLNYPYNSYKLLIQIPSEKELAGRIWSIHRKIIDWWTLKQRSSRLSIVTVWLFLACIDDVLLCEAVSVSGYHDYFALSFC